MSEIINNREQEDINNAERQAILKTIIKDLHNGKNIEDVTAQFQEADRKYYRSRNFKARTGTYGGRRNSS